MICEYTFITRCVPEDCNRGLKNNNDLISTRKTLYFHSPKQICINTHCDCSFSNQSKQWLYENFVDQIIHRILIDHFECYVNARLVSALIETAFCSTLVWNRHYFWGVCIDRNRILDFGFDQCRHRKNNVCFKRVLNEWVSIEHLHDIGNDRFECGMCDHKQ